MDVEKTMLQKLLDAVQEHPVNRLRAEFTRILAAQEAMKPQKTPFELAMEKLKADAVTLPPNFEFEIPQVIGSELWSTLDRGSKLALGKHVKASQAAYGVEFLRTSTSNHAIYRRAMDTGAAQET